MGKLKVIDDLATVSAVVSRIAQGEVLLIDVMPQLMQIDDMINDVIGELEDNAGDWGTEATEKGAE